VSSILSGVFMPCSWINICVSPACRVPCNIYKQNITHFYFLNLQGSGQRLSSVAAERRPLQRLVRRLMVTAPYFPYFPMYFIYYCLALKDLRKLSPSSPRKGLHPLSPILKGCVTLPFHPFLIISLSFSFFQFFQSLIHFLL